MARILPDLVERIAAFAGPQPRAALCLGFHSIDSSGSHISMRPEIFATLMRQLADDGFQGVSTAEWIAGTPMDRLPVILTFDDGFSSVWSAARAILDELGFHATVFAIAAGLGRRTVWSIAGSAIPPMDLMGIPELRAMVATGWEIGSHTVNHAFLPGLSADRLASEIQESRHYLEKMLDGPVLAFAYPYGAWSATVVDAVASAGFRTAWTTRPGRPNLAQRPLLQPRFMVRPNASPVTLRAAHGPLLFRVHEALAAADRLRGRAPRYARFDPGTDCSRFAPRVENDASRRRSV